MRATSFVFAVLFTAVPVVAQQQNRISAFVSDADSTRGGFGVALEHWFAPRFSAELSVARERTDQPVATVGSSGIAITQFDSVRAYPIDLVTRYHFVNGSRFTPWIGAGVRQVTLPNRPATMFIDGVPTTRFVRSVTRSAELDGGIGVRVARRGSMLVGVKRLLDSGEGQRDAIWKTSIGFGWRL